MDVEGMDLRQLLELHDDLEDRRTPVGWTMDDAVVKSRVDRRIMELVMGSADDERRETMRIPCAMRITLRTKHRAISSTVANLGVGGAMVQTTVTLPTGTHVNLEAPGEHGLRARGRVAWTQTEPFAGLGVCFEKQPSAAHERRLHRFVKELLRYRVSE